MNPSAEASETERQLEAERQLALAEIIMCEDTDVLRALAD